MLLQFKVVSDDSIWVIDTQFLNYARVSAPAKDQQSQVLEHGKLVPMGFGVYNFEGRTPKTEGPGAGLCSIGTYLVGRGVTIKILVRTNVPIKDFTMPAPIRQVLYEILPSDPQQLQNSIEEVANAGPQQDTASGPQEPAVERSLPETTAQTEQPETEASVESDHGEVGGEG